MKLSQSNKDILKELFNIGVGKACASLNSIVGCNVELTVPVISIFKRSELDKHLSDYTDAKISSVGQKFNGPFSGTALLVLESSSASKLISLIIDEDEDTPDFDAIRSATLTEIGNILLNGIIGTFGNMVKSNFTYSLPSYLEGSLNAIVKSDYSDEDIVIILVKTKFKVSEHLIEGDFMYLFEVDSFIKLDKELTELDRQESKED